MTATSPAIPSINSAELRQELRMQTQRGMLGNYLIRPVREAFTRMLGEADLPLTVWRELDWYGPLELWRGPEHEVSDILFNGPASDPFFVVQRGVMTNSGVNVHPEWIAWTQRQLLLRSRKLEPAGDGCWTASMAQGVADGLRYAITQEPASRDGGTLSIRLLPERWRSLDDLVQANTITREAATIVLAGMEAGATVIVAGATGSGKTTLTAGFTQEVGKQHRLIFVEDGGELPRTQNSVHLEADSNVVGAFSAAIKFTLRQKPSYVIVGEVRGGEAMALYSGPRKLHTRMARVR